MGYTDLTDRLKPKGTVARQNDGYKRRCLAAFLDPERKQKNRPPGRWSVFLVYLWLVALLPGAAAGSAIAVSLNRSGA